MATIEILEPAGQVQKLAPLQLTPVRELAGLRLAILDNGKPNFQLLATLLAEKLRDDCGLKSIAHHRKEHASVGAGDEILDRIAQSADLVLTGSAD